MSLVGFLFTDTRVHGLAIPGHRHFEEVNLRFYVRRRLARRPIVARSSSSAWLVPRYAIAAIAFLLQRGPCRFRCAITEDSTPIVVATSIAWRYGTGDFSLSATVEGPAAVLASGSEPSSSPNIT